MNVDLSTVHRVHTESGSHVDPPLEQDWDDLTQLRWRAAVARVDTGLDVAVEPGNAKVHKGGAWHRVSGVYEVRYWCAGFSGSSGQGSFRECWAYLNGLSTGAELKRRAERGAA